MSMSGQMLPHQALGALVVTAVQFAGEERGYGNVHALRWEDTGSDGRGQSSRLRIVHWIELGEQVAIRSGDQLLPVEVAENDEHGRYLRTSGFDESDDPILALPMF
jgi:5-deoxy-D-glucuronate isomerase